MGTKQNVIADITIFPIGAGTSIGDYVRIAFKAMKRVRGVKLRPNAMSTVVEASSLQDIMRAVGAAHDALIRAGAKRIAIQLRVDHRLDKMETAKYKTDRIMGRK